MIQTLNPRIPPCSPLCTFHLPEIRRCTLHCRLPGAYDACLWYACHCIAVRNKDIIPFQFYCSVPNEHLIEVIIDIKWVSLYIPLLDPDTVSLLLCFGAPFKETEYDPWLGLHLTGRPICHEALGFHALFTCRQLDSCISWHSRG